MGATCVASFICVVIKAVVAEALINAVTCVASFPFILSQPYSSRPSRLGYVLCILRSIILFIYYFHSLFISYHIVKWLHILNFAVFIWVFHGDDRKSSIKTVGCIACIPPGIHVVTSEVWRSVTKLLFG